MSLPLGGTGYGEQGKKPRTPEFPIFNTLSNNVFVHTYVRNFPKYVKNFSKNFVDMQNYENVCTKFSSNF